MQAQIKTTTGPVDEFSDTDLPFTYGTNTISEFFTAFRLKEENSVKF